jgi:hypothetical protein
LLRSATREWLPRLAPTKLREHPERATLKSSLKMVNNFHYK